MPEVRRPLRDLAGLLDDSTEPLARLVFRMAEAARTRDEDAALVAQEELAGKLLEIEQLADLLGRERVLLEVDSIARGEVELERFGVASGLAYAAGDELPRVRFAEAIRDILAREPRLATSAEAVSRVYTRQHGFALARSTRLEVTKRVQSFIRRSLEQGRTVRNAENFIRTLSRSFSRAYAETVYRTNVNTAFNAGRLRMVRDPAVARVAPALRFTATRDSSVRPNHLAADGLIADAGDPIWSVLSPPLGYNCRCALELVDRRTLARSGLLDETGRVRPARVPDGAYPDPRFKTEGRGRPDQPVY